MNLIRTGALGALGLLALAATPSLASAAAGFATTTVNERAGPGTEYPVVAVIPAGAPVTIYGCIAGWQWCDIDYYGNRGWIFGAYLQAYYQSRPVVITSYGPQLGIPFVSFNFVYWDTYYRARPWYPNYRRYTIPGRPAFFQPKPGGAYVYYPPKGAYKQRVHAKPGGNMKPGYNQLPKPGFKNKSHQASGPAQNSQYGGPSGKKCPMKNGQPYCKLPKH